MRAIRFLAFCSAVVLIVGCEETTQPNRETAAATELGKAASISITDLGTLPGGTFSSANGINARGDIVGSARTATGEEHAVLWRNGTITDLGTLGGTFSQAYAINAAGRVVGRATTSLEEDRGFLWEDGRMTNLGLPPEATYSVALGINAAGVIVAYTDVGFATWERGTWTVLPFPAGTAGCGGGAIDNAGRVVGFCSTETGPIRSFIYERGVPTDLGSVGNGNLVASASSPAGVVVGQFSTENGARPFLWKHGTITELTTRGAHPTFSPTSVNAAGLIAGVILPGNSNTHAALWQREKTIDLGTLPSSTNSYAYGINSSGQIVGTSFNESGEYRAVLWTLH
jgi:probable HAF family extracellular repeat protein